MDFRSRRDEINRRLRELGEGEDGKPSLISQGDLAAFLGVSQAQISRWEEHPEEIPINVYIKWAQRLGVDPATAMSEMAENIGFHPEEINPGNPYEMLGRNLTVLDFYLAQGEAHLPKEDEMVPNFSLSDLKNFCQTLRRKPCVILAGDFDSAKSRICNTLLGLSSAEGLPEGYSPTTSLITILRHIEEKPSDLKDDAVVLSEGFNPDEWDDIAHIMKVSLKRGNQQIIHELGKYTDDDERVIDQARYLMVFLDNPLLRACTIVDLPGYGNNRDKELAESMQRGRMTGDVLIYASPVPGFGKDYHFERVKELLSLLPVYDTTNNGISPLGNFYWVMTHAHPGIKNDEIEKVKKSAVNRFLRDCPQMTEHLSKRFGYAIDTELLASRIVPFWAEDPSRRKELVSDIRLLVASKLPSQWLTRLDNLVHEYKRSAVEEYKKYINYYLSAIKDLDAVRVQYKELLRTKPERKLRVRTRVDEIHKNIKKFEQEQIQELDAMWKELIQPGAVRGIIKDVYKDIKKDAQAGIMTFLVDKFQGRLTQNGQARAELLREYVNQLLDEFEIRSPTEATSSSQASIPFDVRGAFLGGISGLAGVGALAVWTASLGNLGMYIAAAKLSGWLGAVGISVGGKVLVSGLAAIGGPITVFVAVGVIFAFLGYALFGASWEERLAKKVVKAFNEEKHKESGYTIRESFEEGIRNYWKQTLDAFDKGIKHTIKKFDDKIESLREIVEQSISAQDLEGKLNSCQELLIFFERIPWAKISALGSSKG